MQHVDKLNVWYEEELVGELQRDFSGYMGFRYEDSWIRDGFPISLQLPLTTNLYSATEGKAHKFFANLLPEANARVHIVRDLKIVNSDFELLKAIGGECAGALTILPEEKFVDKDFRYKQLNPASLKKFIVKKGSVLGFTPIEDRPRLSLAGAQDKCAIYYHNKRYYLPENSAPSSHIMKFEVADYSHIPAYEYYLTQLAKSIELPVVECELKNIDEAFFLLVKRYDRHENARKKIQRLHQEDFCQALGVSYEKKYQIDGGPSFQDCYRMLQQVSVNPIVDTENLIKWQIFNLLAGNSDGHAKNLALMYHPNGNIRLAPFYDLVCTRAIATVDSKLALAIGGEYAPGNINLKHWSSFAKACNIREQYLFALIKNIAEGLIGFAKPIKEKIEDENGAYPALQRAQKIVTTQSTRMVKILKETKH